MAAEKSLWNVSDLSEYLGVKITTLYSWVELRSLPHLRLGRLVKFKKEDIDEWLENCKKSQVDVEKMTKRAPPPATSKASVDIDTLVRKTIAEVKREGYILGHGKPDRVEGLGKEVSDGSL